MLAIVHFFVDICLLRRAPQDLPASQLVLGLVIGASLLGSMLLAMTAGEMALIGLLQGALDTGFLLVLLYGILRLVDKPTRFLQTGTALIGADTLIGLFALFPLSLAGSVDETSPVRVLAAMVFLMLVVWGVTATAHILRHAFEIRLSQGVFLAIAYDVLSFMVIGGMTQSLG
ncbi:MULTISPECIES: hypothetical protein [Thiorhodovibrio]|uniref:hypothetical protein n=1 Tax=Thiorhodovibrio TaxID=61593 RepID=UPI001912F144|nr:MULTISPECIES: hypothetical protein [Thiorhodovibrio]MBK5967669.1 hypothetical protein [Thiorhodovibrio winogradskyi]WPL11617.1 hypothetical protein Thiosp_01367 [Thiorhodovibrio litoralis]